MTLCQNEWDPYREIKIKRGGFAYGNEEVKGFRSITCWNGLHLGSDATAQGKNLYGVIRKHLEASMEKLQTDYVDLYYLHRFLRFRIFIRWWKEIVKKKSFRTVWKIISA